MLADQFLLAANDGVGAVIVVLIMVASGIINYLKERRAEANRRRQLEESSPQFGNDQLRGEIDQFLSEVAETNRSSPVRRQEEAIELTDDHVIDQRPARKKSARNGEELTRQQRRSANQRVAKESQFGQVAQRHVASQVREHHLHSQVETSHLVPQVGHTVSDGTMSPPLSTQDGSHPLALLLSHSEGVRNAIILNEVLGPPVSRRGVGR